MADHSILPPSSADRWVFCAGSVPMEAMAPDEPKNQDQLDGDAAHYVASRTLQIYQAAGGVVPLESFVGSKDPAGTAITDEIQQSADLYIADVIAACGAGALDKLRVEERVAAPRTVHKDNWGTSDLWWSALGGEGGYLYIYDYKHGHRFVDAFENWQMIDYAACILERPEFEHLDREKVQIIFTIVQPRSFHPTGPIRRWTTTWAALTTKFVKLSQAAYNATQPNPATEVNPECRDCKARGQCPALHAAAQVAMDIAGDSTPLVMDESTVGIELRQLHHYFDLMKARITGLEEQAKGYIRAGKRVPFYQLGQSEGREVWTIDPREAITMGDALGVDLRKPVAVITPAQARKAGMDATIVASLTDKPRGELKLLPVTDESLRKVFDK